MNGHQSPALKSSFLSSGSIRLVIHSARSSHPTPADMEQLAPYLWFGVYTSEILLFALWHKCVK